jgi:hypothetical protein
VGRFYEAAAILNLNPARFLSELAELSPSVTGTYT